MDEKSYNMQTKYKKARMDILMSDKMHMETKNFPRDRDIS